MSDEKDVLLEMAMVSNPARIMADVQAQVAKAHADIQQRLVETAPVSPEPTSAPVVSQKQVSAEDTIQLDRMTIMELELLVTKQQLNESEAQNMILLQKGIKQRALELKAQEAKLMARLTAEFNLPAGSTLRLLDREKGLCKVE